MLSTYLAAFATLLALLALLIAAQAVRYARDVTQWVEQNNAKSLSLARTMALEAELTEIREAIEAVRGSMHKLRSRIATRQRNEAKGEKTADEDPEEWKRRMNLKLMTGGQEDD